MLDAPQPASSAFRNRPTADQGRSASVRLWRVPVLTRGARCGHVFLETPDGCFGWWPRDLRQVNFLLDFFRRTPVAGEVVESERGWIRDGQARCVRVFPVADPMLEALRDSIERHRHGLYQLGNRGGGRNCVGWALGRLRDAGLTGWSGPDPEAPGLAPWHLRGEWHAGNRTSRLKGPNAPYDPPTRGIP